MLTLVVGHKWNTQRKISNYRSENVRGTYNDVVVLVTSHCYELYSVKNRSMIQPNLKCT